MNVIGLIYTDGATVILGKKFGFFSYINSTTKIYNNELHHHAFSSTFITEVVLKTTLKFCNKCSKIYPKTST